MDNKIKFLSEICAQHRLQEKILLVPSYSVGHQIGENLAGNSGSWINLRMTTVTGLAMDLATPEMIGKDLRLIDSQESLLILERLLRDDVSKGSAIRYFEGALEIPGLLKLLGRAILDLRMAGMAPADLKPDSFLVQAKGLEIRGIHSLYEAFLAENKLVDPPELINLAIKRLNHIRKWGTFVPGVQKKISREIRISWFVELL